MHFPRLPDWLVYSAVVLALLFAALGRRERANAPPPPPQPPSVEGAAINPTASFDPAILVRAPPLARTGTASAFSVAESGAWLTAADAVAGCARTLVLVGGGQALEAHARIDPASGVALLVTRAGAPPLPLAPAAPLGPGALGFVAGYPHSRPGELAGRLEGQEALAGRGRGAHGRAALVFAEIGRTEGLAGDLGGLVGAPVLDGAGRVVGVVLGEEPRRGRFYAAPPAVLRQAIAAAGLHPSPAAAGEPITPDDYGLEADALRRDLRIAPIACVRR